MEWKNGQPVDRCCQRSTSWSSSSPTAVTDWDPNPPPSTRWMTTTIELMDRISYSSLETQNNHILSVLCSNKEGKRGKLNERVGKRGKEREREGKRGKEKQRDREKEKEEKRTTCFLCATCLQTKEGNKNVSWLSKLYKKERKIKKPDVQGECLGRCFFCLHQELNPGPQLPSASTIPLR